MNIDLPSPSCGNSCENTPRQAEGNVSEDEDDPSVVALDEIEYVSKQSEVADPNYDENPSQWQPVNAVGMKDIPFTKEEKF